MLRPLLLRQYTDLLPALGLDPRPLFADTGIRPEALDKPDYLVGFEQCLLLFENLAQCRGHAGIGLEFGMRGRLTDSGILGTAALFCRSARQSMEEFWARHGLALGMMTSPRFDDDERSTVAVTFALPPLSREAHRLCIEDAFARIVAAGADAVGDRAVFEHLALAYPEPGYGSRYHEIFRCPVTFNAARTRGVIRRDWIERPLKTHDEAHLLACMRGVDAIVRGAEARSSPVDRVRECLLRAESWQLPSQGEVASALGLSRRSLCRALQQSDTSYRQLVGEVRAVRAMLSLDDDRAPPKEAAYQAGYRNVSAFRRAFRKWTERTVGDYLRNGGRNGAMPGHAPIEGERAPCNR